MTPALPAGSVDLTRKVWLPSARPRRDCGDEHAWNAPPSRLHASVAASETATAKSGEVAFVSAAGAAVNEADGVVRSTCHVYEAVPVLPAASVARTVTVCGASPSEG